MRNLFKKKPKEEIDSAALQPPPVEEFDFIDEADTVSQAEIPQPGQKEPKKGLLGRKKSSDKKKSSEKKKSSKKKNKKQPEKADPKIEEKKDDDDGF